MFRDNITNVERANGYATTIRDGHTVPVDAGDLIEMKLPEFVDHGRIKNAQTFFRSNYYALMYAMYVGLLAILAIPSILNVLVHTNKSSSDKTAYRRYMQTIYHTLSWFRNDLQPGTEAWRSLSAVRKFHFSASRSATNANVGIISQKDMAITQYGFVGFAVLSCRELGLQAKDRDLEDFCHFWRVLGYLIGIGDDYNVCCETIEESLERMEIIRAEFLRPNLQDPPEDFTAMTKYIANGLWCFNPIDTYSQIIFMAKRLSLVPNYFYFDSEFPEDYDRKNLELYNQTRCTRILIWISIITRQFLFRCFVFRWLFNGLVYISEFFIRYFPCLAFFKFGCRDAYVDIRG